MNGAGTSGEADGTSGVHRLAWAGVAAVTLLFCIVNALTVGDDFPGLDPYEPWVWELTSATFWIVAFPLIWLASRRLRPPALGRPAAIAAHLALTLPVCALHVVWLAATRAALYALFGDSYAYDWSWPHLLYEWRKDVLSVAVLAAIGWLVDRWSRVPPQPGEGDRAAAETPTEQPSPFRLEVRDGSRVRWLTPGEIERVEAAGNYVELHIAGGPLLHRMTLAAVETQLAPHGFARIHRSRLVRGDAVTAIETTPAGDFTATLASGVAVAGSRRFRGALQG